MGDCATVCTFDAIHMDRHGLPVVGCRQGTAWRTSDVRPKDLFEIHPSVTGWWVAPQPRIWRRAAEGQ